jgi:hypothetical protein
MTERTQVRQSPRAYFAEAAKKEMLAFERREVEFRKRDRRERAMELQLPLDNISVNQGRSGDFT